MPKFRITRPQGACWFAVGSLVLALAASAVARMTIEPKGFGKAHFGMSPAEVKKLYPNMRTLGRESFGATPVLGPDFVRQLLPAERIEGLSKPVPVELRYWKSRLWVVIVYYGANSTDDVVKYLKKLVGDPSNREPEPMWRGGEVTVNAANRERWYAISDNNLSRGVQVLLQSELAKQRGAAPPAQTPAAADSAKPAAPAHR